MRQLRFAVIGLLLFSACAEDEASVFFPTPDSGSKPSDAGAKSDGGPLDARVDASNIDASKSNVDRTGLNNVGIAADLDYAQRNLWACRPGNEPNECDTDLTATEILLDGGRRIVQHQKATNPEFDCFYVYPTVSLSGGGNMTNFTEQGVALVRDPLRSQAARFTRLCNVYAPMYRQVSLIDGGYDPSASAPRAVKDVTDAFRYFADTLSKDRKFVLIGHSQGTQMLTQLLSTVIDNDAELRERMISAVILGGGVSTPPDQASGGSFKNIPKCEEPGQVGCVIHYVTYSEEVPPTPSSGRFGRDNADAGTQVVCTEPAALANNSGNYRGSYFRMQVNNPTFAPSTPLPEGITTPFVLYRNYFKGSCEREPPFTYLKVSSAPGAGDTRDTPPYRTAALEAAGWGLHLVDFNIELDDLLDAVDLQAKAALR